MPRAYNLTIFTLLFHFFLFSAVAEQIIDSTEGSSLVEGMNSELVDANLIVPVKFWVITKNGVAATNPGRMANEIHYLNLWYQGRVTFRHAGTSTLSSENLGKCTNRQNPENFFDSPNADDALHTLSLCYGDNRVINVFVVRSMHRGTQPLGGIAMVSAFLHRSTPSSLLLVGGSLASYGAVTLTHEIGHILGLQHTAIPAAKTTFFPAKPSTVYTSYTWGCGKTWQYPSYLMNSPWRTERDPLHHTWPGRRTPMSYSNIQLFDRPTFFAGAYGPVFESIFRCWKVSSTYKRQTGQATPAAYSSSYPDEPTSLVDLKSHPRSGTIDN